MRLIDNNLLNYLADKGKGNGDCEKGPKVTAFVSSSNDKLLDRIIKDKGITAAQLRDMDYADYKDLMNELKLEIDSGNVPAYNSSNIKLNKVPVKPVDPKTAAAVASLKQAVSTGKIRPMVTGSAIEHVFKAIAGNDNQISPEELAKFIKQYNPDLPFTTANAKTLIQSLDMDGDAQLGIVEFASLIGKQNPSNDIAEQYRQLFKGLTDGKPKLLVADLITLLQKHNPGNKNIDELVKAADLNKDGEIEFDEFLNMMLQESVEETKAVKGGNKKRQFISKRDSMDYVISRNESLRDRVRLIGKYKPSNLKKK